GIGPAFGNKGRQRPRGAEALPIQHHERQALFLFDLRHLYPPL
ncbi:Gfa-like protein, partial [Methylomonas fluvii]